MKKVPMEKSSATDNELIDLLLKGDWEAFDQLFFRYSEKLYGFALRYLKSPSEAEELVQSVFVKVWEKRTSLQKDGCFNSYLFTIAYNDIKKFFRTKAYQKTYILDVREEGKECDNSVESLDYGFLLEEVEKIIDLLPKRRKEIFLKSRKEGLSSKEIALQLDISPGTVDNNISEALKFLRKRLAQEGISICLFFYLFFS